MAELLRPARRRGRDVDRQELFHEARRGALRQVRRSSRARVPGWPGADRAAVLHEWRGARLQTAVKARVSGGLMAYTFHELKQKTIQDLREIAKGVENRDAVQGYSQMNKDHLLPALCKALGIEAHEHHAVSGIDKPAIKAKMRDLRRKRDEALDAHDHDTLKS